MSHYKFFILFFSIIIFNNLNCFSLRKTKNGDENCETNNTSSYCKSQKYRSILMLIFAILVLICLIIIIIFCIKRMRNLHEIRSLTGNANQNRTDEEIQQEIIFRKKIYYIFKYEIKPFKYTIEKPILDEVCAVCLEKFEKSKLICIMPCKHDFHYNCIHDYILTSKDTLCPLCKFDFLTILNGRNINYNKINLDDLKADSFINNNKNNENNDNSGNSNNILSIRMNNVNM